MRVLAQRNRLRGGRARVLVRRNRHTCSIGHVPQFAERKRGGNTSVLIRLNRLRGGRTSVLIRLNHLRGGRVDVTVENRAARERIGTS
jgi:hypothetical protein